MRTCEMASGTGVPTGLFLLSRGCVWRCGWSSKQVWSCISIWNVLWRHGQQDGLLSNPVHVVEMLNPTPTVNDDRNVRGLVMFPLCSSFCHYVGLFAVSIHIPPVSTRTHLQIHISWDCHHPYRSLHVPIQRWSIPDARPDHQLARRRYHTLSNQEPKHHGFVWIINCLYSDVLVFLIL